MFTIPTESFILSVDMRTTRVQRAPCAAGCCHVVLVLPELQVKVLRGFFLRGAESGHTRLPRVGEAVMHSRKPCVCVIGSSCIYMSSISELSESDRILADYIFGYTPALWVGLVMVWVKMTTLKSEGGLCYRLSWLP